MNIGEIISTGRTIHTGLYGDKALEILISVEGQLSDGIWENSARMERYWRFEFVGVSKETKEILIYIAKPSYEYRYGKTVYNAFCEMSDDEIKKWFANKVKQVVKEEIKDNPDRADLVWKRDCEYVLDYMNPNITVKECYQVYDTLLGRI